MKVTLTNEIFKLYHRDRAQQIQGIIREVVQTSYEQAA